MHLCCKNGLSILRDLSLAGFEPGTKFSRLEAWFHIINVLAAGNNDEKLGCVCVAVNSFPVRDTLPREMEPTLAAEGVNRVSDWASLFAEEHDHEAGPDT
jgi:hypothetical protein